MKNKNLLKTLALSGTLLASVNNVDAQIKEFSFDEKVKVLNWYENINKESSYADSLELLIYSNLQNHTVDKFKMTDDPSDPLVIVNVNDVLRMRVEYLKEFDGYSELLNFLSNEEIIDEHNYNEKTKLSNLADMAEIVKNSSVWYENQSRELSVKNVLKLSGFDLDEIKQEDEELKKSNLVDNKKLSFEYDNKYYSGQFVGFGIDYYIGDKSYKNSANFGVNTEISLDKDWDWGINGQLSYTSALKTKLGWGSLNLTKYLNDSFGFLLGAGFPFKFENEKPFVLPQSGVIFRIGKNGSIYLSSYVSEKPVFRLGVFFHASMVSK